MTKCKFSVGKYERMKKSEKEETPKQTWTSILSVKRFTLIFQHNQCLPICQSTNYLMSKLREGLTHNHFCLISSSVFLQDTFNAASSLLICFNATRNEKLKCQNQYLPSVLQNQNGNLLFPIHISDGQENEKYFCSDFQVRLPLLESVHLLLQQSCLLANL